MGVLYVGTLEADGWEEWAEDELEWEADLADADRHDRIWEGAQTELVRCELLMMSYRFV